jgi:hypothetical protein
MKMNQIDPHKALVSLGYKPSKLCKVGGGWGTLLWRFKTKDGGEHVLRIFHHSLTKIYEKNIFEGLALWVQRSVWLYTQL